MVKNQHTGYYVGHRARHQRSRKELDRVVTRHEEAGTQGCPAAILREPERGDRPMRSS
jgi:hypothetical protein